MCGIFSVLFSTHPNKNKIATYYDLFDKIKNRGPDYSTFTCLENIILGFHRLSINDLSILGSQPFQYIDYNNKKNYYLLCNGEIYNYKKLINKYNLSVNSNSDCEVILPLLKLYHFNLYDVITLLEGEFAIVLYEIDLEHKLIKLSFGRDICGVRPLYYYNDNTSVIVSSLLKGFPTECQSKVGQVEPRIVYQFKLNLNTKNISSSLNYYYSLKNIISTRIKYKNPKKALIESVKSRLHSDRPLGALLSGGLDSSLVCAIASKLLYPSKLKTFSIGIEGSSDLYYAKMVSEYINSEHTTVYFTIEEGFNIIPELILCLETYDITTIRASVGQYLLSKYISNKTDVKVLLNGDGSDEVTLGYLYLHNYPNKKELINENIRLIENIHYFDVLRVDRTVSNFGLEARVPFLDKHFIESYLSVPLDDVLPNNEKYNKQEKGYLRHLFKDDKILPEEVLFRRKEAFSDGVSGTSKKWYQCIQEKIRDLVKSNKLSFDTDVTILSDLELETLYYKKIYDSYFNNNTIIPHYWLPKWSTTKDPSATTLETY